jgi:hypothetical protein
MASEKAREILREWHNDGIVCPEAEDQIISAIVAAEINMTLTAPVTTATNASNFRELLPETFAPTQDALAVAEGIATCRAAIRAECHGSCAHCQIRPAIAAALTAERERCARIVEDRGDDQSWVEPVAAAIRGGGK